MATNIKLLLKDPDFQATISKITAGYLEICDANGNPQGFVSVGTKAAINQGRALMQKYR